MADPLTGPSLLGVWQCQPGIMEEEGVVISGVREEEQPLLDCMFFMFFMNSIDQRPSVSGIIGEEGELVNGRGGRGGAATTLLPPVQPPLVSCLHCLGLGVRGLLKAALSMLRCDLIVKLGPRICHRLTGAAHLFWPAMTAGDSL